MSFLARSAAPLRQVALRSRAAPVRSMHGEYKKGTFGLKVATYLIGGFSIPFVAAYYQLSKSGSA
ncbi:hypothetical protein OH77DRAFT_1523029 [Trametes cingulata]|nr:hypothetical protein OH77DRAFT_1523029 [Trametes cingulata]